MSKKSILRASLLTLMVAATTSYSALAVFDQEALNKERGALKAHSVALTALRGAQAEVEKEGDTSAEGVASLKTVKDGVQLEKDAVVAQFSRLAAIGRAETMLVDDHGAWVLDEDAIGARYRLYQMACGKLENVRKAAADPTVQEIIAEVQSIYVAMMRHWDNRAERFKTQIGGAGEVAKALKGRYFLFVSPDEVETFDQVSRALESGAQILELDAAAQLDPAYTRVGPFQAFSLEGDLSREKIPGLFANPLVKNIYFQLFRNPGMSEVEIENHIAKSSVSVYRQKFEETTSALTVSREKERALAYSLESSEQRLARSQRLTSMFQEEALVARNLLQEFAQEIEMLSMQVTMFKQREAEEQQARKAAAQAQQFDFDLEDGQPQMSAHDLRVQELQAEKAQLEEEIKGGYGEYIKRKQAAFDAQLSDSEYMQSYYKRLEAAGSNTDEAGSISAQHMSYLASEHSRIAQEAEMSWSDIHSRIKHLEGQIAELSEVGDAEYSYEHSEGGHEEKRFPEEEGVDSARTRLKAFLEHFKHLHE